VKIFLAVAIALALIIGGLIYYDRRKTQKLNTVINQQKAELEKLGNVKDKIFSVVSHDMRAPLNSLMSFINILEEGNIAPEKLNLYAKYLKQNLSYTSSLMNNLLNWAASQMQGFKPVKENFDVSAVVTEVANTLQHHWQQKAVRIENDIPANTFVNADVNMTAAILRNLMSNAIKYSFKETEVTITAEQDEAGCIILIQDTGTGMQPGQIAAFNSNAQRQTESTRGTANEKGTGLGLLLCKTFTLQMGGKITAYTNDKGTTFKIWLPAK
jgi:signal transduction histidine kinase